MKKRITALFLALLLCFSIPVSAGAADGADIKTGLSEKLEPYFEKVKFTAGDIGQVFSFGEKLLADAYDGVVNIKTEPLKGSGKVFTAGQIKDMLKKYIFLRVDSPEEAAQLIADNTDITYHLVNGEDGTLYMSVNIEENPEIFDYAVFRTTVDKLYERQNRMLDEDADGKIDYLMSYEHIAGELAIHMLLFAASNEIIQITGITSGIIMDIYGKCAVADLNIDESRLPSSIITLYGFIITRLFILNVLRFLSNL